MQTEAAQDKALLTLMTSVALAGHGVCVFSTFLA